MVVIPAGTFMMGSKADPFAAIPLGVEEYPQHTVLIASFAMGKFEVTQEQWYALMSNLPSSFKGRTLPVEQVSWDDAQEFIKRLNTKTGQSYRLPSEAEWEYAARAGSPTEYSYGDDPKQLSRFAWLDANSRFTTHPVGEKAANSFGLHDMHGNVWEWTQDCWHENYVGAPTDGSAWTTACEENSRVLRGGSWGSGPPLLRSAFRIRDFQVKRFGDNGFRLARDL